LPPEVARAPRRGGEVKHEENGAEPLAEGSDQQVRRLAAAVDPQDPSIVLYTSGTASKPKGVIPPHESLVCEGRNIAERLELGPDDRFWSPLPLFHCGGIATM